MAKTLVLKNDKHELRFEAEYKPELMEEIIDADGYKINTGRMKKIEQGYLKLYVDGKLFGKCFFPADWKLIDTTKINHIYTNYPDGWKINGLKVVFTKVSDKDEYEKFIAEVIAEGTTEEIKAFDAEEKAKEVSKELEELDAIIAEAEKEMQYGDLLKTREDVRKWKQNWNNINNEGGEGFIPNRISQEEYESALKRKEELKGE